MARGRIVSCDVATDEALNGLSYEHAMLYLMTIPHLDRDGLVDGRPLVLWAIVSPLRIELRDKMATAINEWVQIGLVVRYNDDRPVLWFTGFHKHQSKSIYNREGASVFPPPPGYIRGSHGFEPIDTDTTLEQLLSNSRPTQREDQDQLEDQDQDQSDDDDGLRLLIFDLIKEVGWKNTETVVGALDARQLIDLATWLWYARMAKRSTGSAYAVDHDQRIVAERYADHPYASKKIDNPFMYAIAGVRNGNTFPLTKEDRADMIAWIEENRQGEPI